MKTAQKDKDVFKLQTSKTLTKSFDDFQSNKVKFTMLLEQLNYQRYLLQLKWSWSNFAGFLWEIFCRCNTNTILEEIEIAERVAVGKIEVGFWTQSICDSDIIR